jgi:hypothetical protein
MKKETKYIFPILLTLLVSSCDYGKLKPNYSSQLSVTNTQPLVKKENHHHKITKFNYDTLTIPSFFTQLIENHIDDFYEIDSNSYIDFCVKLDLDNKVRNDYYSIVILHQIFTSKSAINCSKGNILNIPYQWHWVNPNPRHKIYFTKTNHLLKDEKPPKEFSKYNSFADIDRTPYLYLSDLIDPEIKYYSKSCDSFSTFGWCSEREMAFVALTKLLKFESKVVAEGNHSWTELLLPLKTKTGTELLVKLKVDNTFDVIKWAVIKDSEVDAWRKYFGNTKLSNWYNQKAKSETELAKIKSHLVSAKAANRIENAVVKYLNSEINMH